MRCVGVPSIENFWSCVQFSLCGAGGSHVIQGRVIDRNVKRFTDAQHVIFRIRKICRCIASIDRRAMEGVVNDCTKTRLEGPRDVQVTRKRQGARKTVFPDCSVTVPSIIHPHVLLNMHGKNPSNL